LAVLEPVYFLAALARGVEQPLLVHGVIQNAQWLMLVVWMTTDAKERRQTPGFDFGFFLLILYPISLFWYCIHTRGWRGLGLSLGLLLLTQLPAISTVVVVFIWSLARALRGG